ncbi:MAG: HAMP domain-containing histidine kinase [Legionellales bacterium]|nr:HAMP domain-containing histidine kinase [Legionellales bacterium]
MVISNTLEIRRLLALVSSDEHTFSVIDDNNIVYLPDYKFQDLVDEIIKSDKIKHGCEINDFFTIAFHGRTYQVLCSIISKPGIISFKGSPYLISFNLENPLKISINTLLYFLISTILIFLITYFWFGINLKRKLLNYLYSLEVQIKNKNFNFIENVSAVKDDKIPLEIENIRAAFQQLLSDLGNETNKRIASEKKAAISTLAAQVAHDIRSPVAAIQMLSKENCLLPENTRKSLKDAAARIQDIANNLLSQYKTGAKDTAEQNSLFLISDAISAVVSEKKLQYSERKLNLHIQAQGDANLAFIYSDPINFKRMLSNLLNNSIEAIGEEGSISIVLHSSQDYVDVRITDDGCGMSSVKIANILNGNITSTKNQGSGLGLQHARDFMKNAAAKFDIQSTERIGTTIHLQFKRSASPPWLADKISIKKQSTIIILDDDVSIHGAWDRYFADRINVEYGINILHFHQAAECILTIKNNFNTLKDVIILTDFELLNQNMNGLDVVEHSGVNNTILVTSYYDDRKILARAVSLNAKVLPKMLASEIEIEINEQPQNFKIPEAPKNEAIDIVLLEDNQELSDIFAFICERNGKQVKIYHNPYSLFTDLNTFDPLATKICLDLNLGFDPVNGIDIAILLHNKGFKQIYLASGSQIDPNSVPEYLMVLKNKIDLTRL